jgi:hypothetical protein
MKVETTEVVIGTGPHLAPGAIGATPLYELPRGVMSLRNYTPS